MLLHAGFGILIVAVVALWFAATVGGCLASSEALSRSRCTSGKLCAAWFGVTFGVLLVVPFANDKWGWHVLLIAAPLLMNALALVCHYWPGRAAPKQRRRRP